MIQAPDRIHPAGKGRGCYRRRGAAAAPPNPCSFNNCLAFDGINDRVSWLAAQEVAMQFGTADFQIEFWMKPAANAYSAAFNVGAIDTSNAAVIIGPSNDPSGPVVRVSFRANGITRTVYNSLNPGYGWKHVVVQKRVSGGFVQLTIYDNGLRQDHLLDTGGGTAIPATATFNPSGRPKYGARYVGDPAFDTNGNFFSGQLDDVRVGTYLYSDLEVLDAIAQQQCLINPSYEGLLRHRCRLDSTSGTLALDDRHPASDGNLSGFTGTFWVPHV